MRAMPEFQHELLWLEERVKRLNSCKPGDRPFVVPVLNFYFIKRWQHVGIGQYCVLINVFMVITE